MAHRRILVLTSVVWGLLGCGKTTANDGEDPGGTDDGVCEIEFEETAPGTRGEFTVRNDRAVPIYIPMSISGCTFEAWQVLDGDTPVYWYDDAYVPTCNSLLSIDCQWGCSDGPASAIKIAPGASWTEEWGYYVWTPVELTAACVEGTGCASGTTCWAGRVEDSGTLTARLRVTETCDFADSCDCGGSACLITVDSLSIGDAQAELVDIEFDASASEILLVIE